MHLNHVRHFPERERVQVFHALLEEISLPVNNEIHNLEHGLASLFDRLDEPARAVQLLSYELAILTNEFLLVACDLLIDLADSQARYATIIEKNPIDTFDLLDRQVWHHIGITRRGETETWFRVEARQLVRRILNFFGVETVSFGQLTPPMRDEVIEGFIDETLG